MAEPGQHLYDSNMAGPGPDPAPRRRERILTYSLFGESAHLPDVLHCETIAARSVLHEWEFEPHGHARLHQLLLLETGRGVVQLEAGPQPLGPMTLVNVPPGEIHGFRFERGTQGYVATLAEEMRGRGARVLLAAPEGTPGAELPLTCTGNEDLDPIAAVQSFYPMVEALAQARGLNPDQPRHLAKVTKTH